MSTPLVDACVRRYGVGEESLVANHSRLESVARELERRLSEILEIVDGMEDIDANGGPNLAMRIAQVARGEDRP